MSALCPSCGEPTLPDSRFCGSCGAKLERTCPKCGALSPPSYRFCGSCGAPLDAAIAEEAATLTPEERKVVTVVFADLATSTELAARLDPEDLRAVLRPFFDAMVEEIERFGGTVEKFIGDAVVAVFGVPVAHEDDPERAVRAAFAMQGRMRALNEQLADAAGGDLAMRVGVNTGDVLAAHRTAQEGYVTGEAVNLAARLQALAEPGAVVVGERTHSATSHAIAYRHLGDVSVKGFDRPIPVWEGLPDVSPVAPRRGLDSPMVGRDDELDLLRLLFARTVKEGKPNLVTLLGPPGIGKSRLSYEFSSLIVSGSARVVRGRCLPYEGGLYWPMAEVLKADAGILDSDPPDAIVLKARTRLEPRFAGSHEGLGATEVLLSSIGIETGSDPLAGVEPAAARRVIAGAWRRYFDSLCDEQPVVALIEDIHWADDSLLELLEFLAARVSGSLLLLCMARPELWEGHPAWGAGLSNANTIALSPLSADDGSMLIGNLLGGGAPEDVVGQIIRRCEGNPFFAGELLRMMVEDGTLEQSDGTWNRTRDLPSSLPDTVQGVIASRIDLLSPTEKRAIQDAAVVGRTFWAGAVARLGASDAEQALDGLVEKELVHERDDSAIAQEREYIFHHILTRDVAYESIPRSQRADAHKAVSEWIEVATRGRDEEFAEILSYHAERAGDLERTARFAMLAGHRHRRVFAAAEAIDWYDRALAAIGQLSSDTSALLLVETALSRGEACEQLGRFVEAHVDYQRALDAARERPEGSREWLESRALAALVHVLWNEDRYADGEALLPEALEAASAQGADDLVARLLYTAGSMGFGQGDWNRALSYHQRALEVATSSGDIEVEALARHGLTETRFFTGPFDEALSHGLQADTLLRSLGQRPMVHHNEYMIAWLHWLLGDPGAAGAAAESALAGCRDVGNRRDEAFALATLAVINVSHGDLDGATRVVDEAVAVSDGVGAPRLELTSRFWRSWVLSEVREHERFAEDVRVALEIGDTLGGRFLRAPLESAWGWVQAREGHAADAEASFAGARRLAGDTVLELLLAIRLELQCWEELGDPSALADTSRRLGDVARDRSPLFNAWAEFGLALADLLRGDAGRAARGAAAALGSAILVSEVPVMWRSYALLGQAEAQLGRPGESAAAIAQAEEILMPMVERIDDERTRVSFLSRPDVAAVVTDADPR